MPATRAELLRIAELSIRQRKSTPDIAREIGVNAATVLTWMRQSDYVDTVYTLRKKWKQEARARVAGLAEDVMLTLEDLMRYSRNDRIKYESARTLGEWLGLDEPEADTKGDERDDLVEALKLATTRTQAAPTIVFLPPSPGGLLPEYLQAPRPAVLDVTPLFRSTTEEKEKEKEGEERE